MGHSMPNFYCLDSSFGFAIGLGVVRAAGDVGKLVCISNLNSRNSWLENWGHCR